MILIFCGLLVVIGQMEFESVLPDTVTIRGCTFMTRLDDVSNMDETVDDADMHTPQGSEYAIQPMMTQMTYDGPVDPRPRPNHINYDTLDSTRRRLNFEEVAGSTSAPAAPLSIPGDSIFHPIVVD